MLREQRSYNGSDYAAHHNLFNELLGSFRHAYALIF